jgi:hypothetical protein
VSSCRCHFRTNGLPTLSARTGHRSRLRSESSCVPAQ